MTRGLAPALLVGGVLLAGSPGAAASCPTEDPRTDVCADAETVIAKVEETVSNLPTTSPDSCGTEDPRSDLCAYVAEKVEAACPGLDCLQPWIDFIYGLPDRVPDVTVADDLLYDDEGMLVLEPPTIGSPELITGTARASFTAPASEYFAIAVEPSFVPGPGPGMATSGCAPSNPRGKHYYDPERSPGHWYDGGVGVVCEGAMQQVHCYMRIERKRDGAPDVAWNRDSHWKSCVAYNWKGFYQRRTSHRIYGELILEAPSNAAWYKHGEGYVGWQCHGWRTSVLTCYRYSGYFK